MSLAVTYDENLYYKCQYHIVHIMYSSSIASFVQIISTLAHTHAHPFHSQCMHCSYIASKKHTHLSSLSCSQLWLQCCALSVLFTACWLQDLWKAVLVITLTLSLLIIGRNDSQELILSLQRNFK